MSKVHVKTGDTVIVLSGKDKGKTGQVMAVSPKEGKVIVEKVNMVSNQNRCFGDSFNPITFSGTQNTKFNWINSNANIGLAASGTGNIPAFVAKGTVFGGSSVVGNLIVTPEINGCFGLTKSLTTTHPSFPTNSLPALIKAA